MRDAPEIQGLLLAIPQSFVSEVSIVRGTGPFLRDPGFSMRLKQTNSATQMTFIESRKD